MATFNVAQIVVVFSVLTVVAACASTSGRHPDADVIRATERERLAALVSANVEVASRLHADDFQLINPSGGSVSKDQYLGLIASGEVDYLFWEPESPIEVRQYGAAAVIRYLSQIELVVQGNKVPRLRYWHTDSYERRGGRWQIVWSQATEIKGSIPTTAAEPRR